MKRWMKVLLLTLLAGMVIAGLGSVLPARAADGEEILYRVNSGGPEVPVTDGGPNWERDDANSGPNRSPYYKGDSTDFFSFGASDLGGQVQGAAPANVYRMGRQATSSNPTIRYEFPVTAGRTYRINLYFVDPRDDNDYVADTLDRVFDVQVNGSVPSAFNNITLARIRQSPRWYYRVPVMVTAEVTMPSNDSTLDLVWVRYATSKVRPHPVVSGIEIIELVPQDTTPPTMLCDLDDGSLNAHHCGRPVAIFRSGDELHLYGIDINTGNGSLALLVTAADIESAGVPEDVPVLIAVGENPYTHRPIALYRLPGGEFQLNTAYWDGKEYIVKWQPGAAHVEVIYW